MQFYPDAWHVYFFGLLIGWGVAIPIGPMNLEIIRRNLTLGIRSGLSFGFGIISADLTYLLLLNLGVLVVLAQNHRIMLPVGIIGSLILLWFAVKTLKMQPGSFKKTSSVPQPLWRQMFDGYILTVLSPFTILFWASMSSEIAVSSGRHLMLPMALGVMTGVCSWMVGLNIVLHFTRHRLSDRLMHFLNRAGGVILLLFALFGLWHSVHLFW